jgi:tetratricopeptide (TPR) repeat protein
LSNLSRGQAIFGIITVLVICSMVGGVFVGLTFTDVFGDLFSDDGNEENFTDPNSDIVSAQETMVANNPDDLEDVLLLASLLANSGRLGDAIPHFENALDLAPDDVDARLTFARALADGDMQADAELQFTKVLEMDPDNQQAHYYLAELYMAWEPVRSDEAIPHYQRSVEIDPTTLIGERSQTQLDSLGANQPDDASPAASPSPSTPVA